MKDGIIGVILTKKEYENYSELKKKNMPMKKVRDQYYTRCPMCAYVIDNAVPSQKYCDNCGQRLKWTGGLNIKTAEELYKITLDRRPEIVESILAGVREHIIEKCEEEANRGITHYTIYLTKGNIVVKDLLLIKCLELAREFEEHGYNVVIRNYKDINNEYVSFRITVYWGNENDYTYKDYDNIEVLYNTNKIQYMTRKEKIEFLKQGQKEIGQFVNYDRFGDFSTVSDKKLDELVEELDWMWK